MPRTKKGQIRIKQLLRALRESWFYRLQWKDRYYLSKEKALQILKYETEQDFGYDVNAWKRWFDENPDFEFKR